MKLRLRATRRGPRRHAQKSCDSYNEFCVCIVNIVVALVDMHVERSLTWLPGVYNHDLPNSLLASVEHLIFQVWLLYHGRFVSYKWFLDCQLNVNVAKLQ